MDELAAGAFWTGFAANLALAAYAWSVLPARTSALQAGVALLLAAALAAAGRRRRRERAAIRWLGAATFAFQSDLFTQVLRMNLGRTGRLEHAGLSVALYAVFVVAWTVRLLRRFAKPA